MDSWRVQGVGEYSISDFLQSMSPTTPSYIHPTSEDDFWVFWSKEGDKDCLDQTKTLSPCDLTETRTIDFNFKEYLLSALRNCASIWDFDDDDYLFPNFLVQIWAPKTIGGQLMLTTSHQPFALKRIEKGLCEYRKHCINLEFNVNGDGEEFGGVIGRVFRQERMRSYSKIEYYSVKQYPLRHFALKCGVEGSWAMPVFYPSGRCCAGVLEILDTGDTDPCPSSIDSLVTELLEIKESTEDRVIIDEINKALQVVCTTHQLPLAQTWIPCCSSAAMDYDDSPDKTCCCYFPYLSCSDTFSSSIYDFEMKWFNMLCNDCTLRKGQGLVGKALLYHKPAFCRDVTKLPIAEYPLSHHARKHGLTGCYAICLHHTTGTKNHDYVLEFFLPLGNRLSGDPKTFLELILATVKNQLPGFKICSLEELCIEVHKISMSNEQDSFIMSQTTSVQPIPESFANESETMQNKVVGETFMDNGSNILGLKHNDIEYSEKTVGVEFFAEAASDDEITTGLPPLPESLQNETKVVQLSDESSAMEEAVRKNEVNVAIAKQKSVALTSAERISSRAEASKERGYRTTNISLSRDDLIKHFGKKLDDAAEILGVSRSTMKRLCRIHKIDKWPAPKRKKVNPSSSNLKNVKEVVRSGNEGTDKGDPSCSKPPPMPATPAIPHKQSNATPREQVVGTVTIKATYGVDTLRFQLPFSSRKMDLVEKVTKRVSLNEGSFNIKYQDEDGDWVLIACDEDLEECFGISKGKSIIKMLVHPITNQAP